jgi:hypothetical protein
MNSSQVDDSAVCGRASESTDGSDSARTRQSAVAAPAPVVQDIFGDSNLGAIFVFFAIMAWISDYFRAKNCSC